MTKESIEKQLKISEFGKQVDLMINEYQKRYGEEIDSQIALRTLAFGLMKHRGLIPYASLLILRAFKVGLLVSTEGSEPKITLPSGEIIFKLNDNS